MIDFHKLYFVIALKSGFFSNFSYLLLKFEASTLTIEYFSVDMHARIFYAIEMKV